MQCTHQEGWRDASTLHATKREDAQGVRKESETIVLDVQVQGSDAFLENGKKPGS